MVNLRKLRGKLTECGYSIERVADIIEVDKSTLYRQLNGNGENIPIGEAYNIVKLLKLSSSEATDIFFASDVA